MKYVPTPLTLSFLLFVKASFAAPVSPEACTAAFIGDTEIAGTNNLPQEFQVLGDDRFFLTTVIPRQPHESIVDPSVTLRFDRSGEVTHQSITTELYQSVPRTLDSYHFGFPKVFPGDGFNFMVSRTSGSKLLLATLNLDDETLYSDLQSTTSYASGYSTEQQLVVLKRLRVRSIQETLFLSGRSKETLEYENHGPLEASDYSRFTLLGHGGHQTMIDLEVYRDILERVNPASIRNVRIANGFPTTDGKFLLWGWIFDPDSRSKTGSSRVKPWIAKFKPQGEIDWVQHYTYNPKINDQKSPENRLARIILHNLNDSTLNPDGGFTLLPDGGFILRNYSFEPFNRRSMDGYITLDYARVSSSGVPQFGDQLRRPFVAKNLAGPSVSALADGRILTLEKQTINVLESSSGTVLQQLVLPSSRHTLLPTQQDKLPDDIYVAGMDNNSQRSMLIRCSP